MVKKTPKIAKNSDRKFYEDVMCNQVVISIAKNPVHHDQTKHVEIDLHFIKKKIEEMMISLVYTPPTL